MDKDTKDSSKSNDTGLVEVELLRKMLQRFNEDYGTSENEKQRYMTGRLLTIVDASFTNPEQRKAVKDMVNDVVWRLDMPGDFHLHNEIRKLTEALGFELYVDTGEMPLNVPNSEFNRYESLV